MAAADSEGGRGGDYGDRRPNLKKVVKLFKYRRNMKEIGP